MSTLNRIQKIGLFTFLFLFVKISIGATIYHFDTIDNDNIHFSGTLITNGTTGHNFDAIQRSTNFFLYLGNSKHFISSLLNLIFYLFDSR